MRLAISLFVVLFVSCAPAMSVVVPDRIDTAKPRIFDGKLVRVYYDLDETKTLTYAKYGFFSVYSRYEEKDIFYACKLQDRFQVVDDFDDLNGKSAVDIAKVDQCFMCVNGNCENTIYNQMCTVIWKGSGVKFISGPTQRSGYLPNTNQLMYLVCQDGFPYDCPIFERCRYSYKAKNADEYFQECVNTCQCVVAGVSMCD